MFNKEFIRLSILTAIILFGVVVANAGEITGKVTNPEGNLPIEGVSVILEGTPAGSATDKGGAYTLAGIPRGKYRVVFSAIGYSAVTRQVTVEDQPVTLDVSLSPSPLSLSEVVVAGSRTEQAIGKIAANVTVLNRTEIASRSANSVDDLLGGESGISAGRPQGIFTSSPSITLRGIGGNETGRTLVLVDGMPINKADTGEANLNRIKTATIERIEVVRGPGSSLYGSSAMGGVINIITRRSQPGLQLNALVKGGSFGTMGSDLSLGYGWQLGKSQLLNLHLAGSVLKSDGYIDVPENLRTDYTISRFLAENNQLAKLSYRIGLHELAASFQRYDDHRGEGEKIRTEEGEYRSFGANITTLQYRGAKENWNWSGKLYYQYERYFKIDERMRGANYSRFDVLSHRIDQGMMSQASVKTGSAGTISFGADMKMGSVDGADVYLTSPDIVINRGKLTTYSAFLQDELPFMDELLNLTLAIRFDQVRFHEGEFNSTSNPFKAFNSQLEENSWSELSPKVGVTYRPNEKTRLYGSYAKAFRGSILDDLCRSGFAWIGPKIANPNLTPETVHNFEVGIDRQIGNSTVTLTAYTMLGDDFLYYVTTGDSVSNRPSWERKNVAGVTISGVEVSTKLSVNKWMAVTGSFTGALSEIGEFPERKELEGKELALSPAIRGKLGFETNRWVNSRLTWELVGKQWADDINTTEIPAYGVVHLKLSREIVKGVTAGLDIRNLFNKEYTQSTSILDPGRFIIGSVSYDFK